MIEEIIIYKFGKLNYDDTNYNYYIAFQRRLLINSFKMLGINLKVVSIEILIKS